MTDLKLQWKHFQSFYLLNTRADFIQKYSKYTVILRFTHLELGDIWHFFLNKNKLCVFVCVLVNLVYVNSQQSSTQLKVESVGVQSWIQCCNAMRLTEEALTWWRQGQLQRQRGRKRKINFHSHNSTILLKCQLLAPITPPPLLNLVLFNEHASHWPWRLQKTQEGWVISGWLLLLRFFLCHL